MRRCLWILLAAACGSGPLRVGEFPAVDAGVTDAGLDAGDAVDADVADAAVPDAAVPDAGEPDAGVADAGPADAGLPDAGTVASPGCPDGGACTYLVRTAWWYDCVSSNACARASAIGDYGTFEACQTWGCMSGNSRCGDQFGNSDADRWACEACKVSCHDGSPSACAAEAETAQGCVLSDSTWGQYVAACDCR